MSEQRRPAAVAYWTLGVVLIAFGFLGIFSIGAPFLLTGLAMSLVGPWRRNRAVLWPALVAVWAFVVGYVLVAPLGCTSSGGSMPALPGASFPLVVSHTVCTNILGIDYSGRGVYNPSLVPGLLAGLVAGVIGALLVRVVLVRRIAAGAG